MENNKVKINCPKCDEETEFSLIKDAVDEHGEVYICQHCRYPFRFALR